MWRRPTLPSARRVVRTHLHPARPCNRGVAAAFSSSAADEHALAASSALRQQLEFCCLVSGWDTPCTTCPIDWRGFDPKERYRISRRSPRAARDVEDAVATLGIGGDSDAASLSAAAVKAAFRRKALEWHPDINSDPQAEEKFREILAAYELLLGMLSS